MSKVALIVVDMERDFIDGSLAVPDADKAVDAVEKLLRERKFDAVAFTRDLHPANHFSFSENPEYRDGSWPPHGVVDTPGSNIDTSLLLAAGHNDGDAAIFNKGQDWNIEQYSGFEAEHDVTGQPLYEWLDERYITHVVIVGLALDYCVLNTAIDFDAEGYATIVPVETTRAVAYETGTIALKTLFDRGVWVEPVSELDRLLP
jgi:nicotinamidase-related amidase